MSVMKGVCPKCGTVYYGWALDNPLHRKCEECDSHLEISEHRETIVRFDPFYLYPKYKVVLNQTKERIMAN